MERPFTMKQLLLTALLWCFLPGGVKTQSFEVMGGTERIFVDVQWLRAFDAQFRWTLFSRSRATVDYEDNTNLFTGAYLNYTTRSGFGPTLVGRISSFSGGADIGPHFFRTKGPWLIYALASVTIRSELSYSWFSIVRFRPAINDRLKLFAGLELFSSFDKNGHVASVQRVRLGLDQAGFQYGLAVNLSGVGESYEQADTNPGLFVRKEF